MITKIFIVGNKEEENINIAKDILAKNDDLSICQKFTNDKNYKDIATDDYIFYLDQKDVDLAYKNNAFLFVTTNNFISTGITFDSFYNDDIFYMNIQEFNNIPDYIFLDNDIIIAWIDRKCHGKTSEETLSNIPHFLDKLSKCNYLYFINESIDEISDCIIKYIYGSIEEKQQLLDENC